METKTKQREVRGTPHTDYYDSVPRLSLQGTPQLTLPNLEWRTTAVSTLFLSHLNHHPLQAGPGVMFKKGSSPLFHHHWNTGLDLISEWDHRGHTRQNECPQVHALLHSSPPLCWKILLMKALNPPPQRGGRQNYLSQEILWEARVFPVL